jgi:hypothetical protein
MGVLRVAGLVGGDAEYNWETLPFELNDVVEDDREGVSLSLALMCPLLARDRVLVRRGRWKAGKEETGEAQGPE